jgi:hypothetical protein
VSRWPFNRSVCVVLRSFCVVLELVLHTLWREVVGRREAQLVGAVRAHPYAEPLCTPSWETWTRHQNKNSKTKNPWHGFRKNQRSTRSTNKRPKRKLGPLRKSPGGTQAHIGKDQAVICKSTFEDQARPWQNPQNTGQSPGFWLVRPGKDQAHFGKDQATARHTRVKTGQSRGTLWQRPGKDPAHFGKDQAETRHTLEKTKRSLAQVAKDQTKLGTLRTRPNEVWHTLDKTKRSLAHFGEDQTKLGTLWLRPNEVWHNLEKTKRSLAHVETQAETRYIIERTKRNLAHLAKNKRSLAHFVTVQTKFGTLWIRPNEVWHTLVKAKRSLAYEESQAETRYNMEKTKRSLAHVAQDQTKFGTFWKRPNEVRHTLEKTKRGLAHFGKDQTRSGTLWKRPNEVWHTKRPRRSPGTLWKRPHEFWHIQGNEPFGLNNKTVTCRFKVRAEQW